MGRLSSDRRRAPAVTGSLAQRGGTQRRRRWTLSTDSRASRKKPGRVNMARRQRASWARVASLAAIGTLLTAPPLAAQRRSGTQQQSGAAASATVRAELAAVLLQSKRYGEAAREYR